MLCIHIYFIWVLYLPLNLCLSMPTKSRHISLKCQFYSVCECLSVCMCVANVTASQKRARTSPKWHCDQIYYENMNGLYKMWYSHEMNDEWFMAFHFEPFPCVRFNFVHHSANSFQFVVFFPLYSSFAIFHFAIKLYHCYCIYTIYVHLRIFRMKWTLQMLTFYFSFYFRRIETQNTFENKFQRRSEVSWILKCAQHKVIDWQHPYHKNVSTQILLDWSEFKLRYQEFCSAENLLIYSNIICI